MNDLFSSFYRKSDAKRMRNLPAPLRNEVIDALEATSVYDIR